MKAEARRVPKWAELEEVDQEVFEKAKKTMTREDRNILRVIHNGGGLDKVKVWQKMDDEVDIRCRYCGAEEQTTKHIVWECPCFAEERKEEQKLHPVPPARGHLLSPTAPHLHPILSSSAPKFLYIAVG